MLNPESELAGPVFIVINDQGFSIGSTRVYTKLGTARQVISSKTTEWNKRKKYYLETQDRSSFSKRMLEQEYRGEAPVYTILEGNITWKVTQ